MSEYSQKNGCCSEVLLLVISNNVIWAHHCRWVVVITGLTVIKLACCVANRGLTLMPADIWWC